MTNYKIVKDGDRFVINDGDVTRLVEDLHSDRVGICELLELANADIEYDDYCGLSSGDPDIKERWVNGFIFSSAFASFGSEEDAQTAVRYLEAL